MKKTVSWMIDEIEKNNENIIFLYRWLAEGTYTEEESERLSEYLCDKIDDLKTHVPTLLRAGIDRSKNKGWKYLDYRDDRRDGYPRSPKPDEKMEKEGKHLREENYLAMEIYRLGRMEDGNVVLKPIEKIGYVLDYEMPIGGNTYLLKATENSIFDRDTDEYKYAIIDSYKKDGDENLFKPGKCDLISYEKKHFTIFELKTRTNTEPLIRAVMEAFTYLNLLDTKRATDCYRRHYKCLNIPNDNITWRAALLLSVDGSQYKEYMNKDSFLKKLMKKIEVEPIWYNAGFCVK